MDTCGNEIQACASEKINGLGVPTILPNMALQTSLYGMFCLHFIEYPITFMLKQSCDKQLYIWANCSHLTTYH